MDKVISFTNKYAVSKQRKEFTLNIDLSIKIIFIKIFMNFI